MRALRFDDLPIRGPRGISVAVGRGEQPRGRPGLLAYALLVGAALASFVLAYEEPTLSEQFGAEYEAYRQAVPRWLPRRRAWVR